MTALAEITIESRDEIVVATVTGEIDASNADDLGSKIRETLSNDATALVVDLADTGYIDSAGLNLLFQLHVELKARQQELGVVVRPGSPVERTMSITGLDEAARIHQSRSDALGDRPA